MREIIFRGKRIDNGEWVEGYLAGNGLICCGEPEDTYNATGYYYGETPYVGFVDVDPSTVGQFAGFHDKNGKKIFEGDVFREEDDLVCVVIFEGGGFCLKWYGYPGIYTESGYDECGGEWRLVDCEPVDMYNFNVMEVIGNIHDNKELLEGL